MRTFIFLLKRMKLLWLFLVVLGLLFYPEADSLTWTSSTSLPDNGVIKGCRGHNLDLLWGYQLEPGTSLSNINWMFNSTIIVIKSDDSFMPRNPPFGVQEATNTSYNAGITLLAVDPALNNGIYSVKVEVELNKTVAPGETQVIRVEIDDSPTLSSPELQAEIVAGSIRDSGHGHLHVRLACGSFNHLGDPPVEIVWKTPDSTVLSSTSEQNGTFYLDIDSTHPNGEYACLVKPHSIPVNCIGANSPLSREAHVQVDESSIRDSLLQEQMKAIQAENADLTDTMHKLTSQLMIVMQTSATLVNDIPSLQSERQSMESKMDNMTQELTRLREENAQQLFNLTDSFNQHSLDLQDFVEMPVNCQDVQSYNNTSGQHVLFTRGRVYRAYCDQDTDGGGWMVISRRVDGSVDFYRDWMSYENGFGDLNAEHWLGLEKLHWLTSSGRYTLRVQLTDHDDSQAVATYANFTVDDYLHHYRLHVDGYSGNGGDSLRLNNNRGFTTYDSDNDLSHGNCAKAYHGAFWYGDCTSANLNGRYYSSPATAATAGNEGMFWYDWKSDTNSLKSVTMMVKPK